MVDSVLGPQPLEPLHEFAPVRVQLGFRDRARASATAEHERVEMTGEAQQIKATATVGADRQALQVLVVEVAMGHADRLAAVARRRGQRGGVILGVQERGLATDQLACWPGPRTFRRWVIWRLTSATVCGPSTRTRLASRP